MKILVLCQYYYPEPFRLPDICRELVQRGHSVTVVTGTPNYPEGEIYPGYEHGAKADEVIGGVRVHRCPLIPRKTGVLRRFLNYYSFAASSKRYLGRRKEDYDVVFVNQLSPVMMARAGLDWAKRHHKKCVLYCLDLWPDSLLTGGIREGSLIYRVFLGVSRKIYRRADRVLISSQGFRERFLETLGVEEERLSYLPQYAEALFDTLPPSPEKDTVDFLFAGNIGKAQSVETIVAAAGRLLPDRRIRIHIVGSGVCLDDCRKAAGDLPNVIFYGRRALTEMPEFYAMADVLLVTLSRDPLTAKTLPGKLQSYMAAGKPVLGAADGETGRVIAEAGCGICVPAEDPDALAEAMAKMASEPEKWASLGENARSYYQKNFREEIFMERLEKALRECCVPDGR